MSTIDPGRKPNAMVPELGVADVETSLRFYRDLLGFSVLYQRRDEGFAYLALGSAELMLDQIGRGRDFGGPYEPSSRPFGRGMNLQIRVDAVSPLLSTLAENGIAPFVPLEEVWYRRDDHEVGNRQFVVADPDGYLLRFFEDLGARASRDV